VGKGFRQRERVRAAAQAVGTRQQSFDSRTMPALPQFHTAPSLVLTGAVLVGGDHAQPVAHVVLQTTKEAGGG